MKLKTLWQKDYHFFGNLGNYLTSKGSCSNNYTTKSLLFLQCFQMFENIVEQRKNCSVNYCSFTSYFCLDVFNESPADQLYV